MEFFKEIGIQSSVIERFSNGLKTGRLAHAYLFYGPEGGGKEAIAFEIAKALNCENEVTKPCNECPPCIKINQLKHPDIKFIIPGHSIILQTSSDRGFSAGYTLLGGHGTFF